jgi:O-antigen ligase
VASVARSAWVGWLAGLLLFGFLRGRRWFLGIAAAGTATAALALAFAPAVRERAATFFAMGDDPRLRLWATALRIGADYPILGAGVGSFGSLFPTYRVPGWYMATGHPHSDPLNILVETGWVGVLAWFAIWVAFFFDTRTASPAVVAAAPAKSPRAGLLAAMRAGMFAMLIAGFGQCYSTDEEVAEVWWLCAATGLAFAAHARGPFVTRAEPALSAAAARGAP